MRMKDLTGQRFGRWTVKHRSEDFISKNGRHRIMWHCVCDCGKERDVRGENLLSGDSRSCGCLLAETASEHLRKMNTKHGGARSRLVTVWYNMKARCYNPRNTAYKNYGGRGISICHEWLDDFNAFKTWAINNGYNDSLSIDRINVDGNYEPSNCRWVDDTKQCNNRRNNNKIEADGQVHTVAEWARILGISYTALYQRLSSGKKIVDMI